MSDVTDDNGTPIHARTAAEGDPGSTIIGSKNADTIMDFHRGSNKLRFVDVTAKAAHDNSITGTTVTISASGKITAFSAAATDLDKKITAIQGDVRFDASKKIAFFKDGAHTYVYHTGMGATHNDDTIVKLNNFRPSNMDVSDASMLIGTVQTSVEDISFS